MATILIAGGSGLIGRRLSQILQEKGHQVRLLSRTPQRITGFPAYKWDVDRFIIDPASLVGVDYIINLAGEGIADKRWTRRRRAQIIRSRADSARLLAKAMMDAPQKPQAYISSAAIGFYGNRADSLLQEDDRPGQGFLAESCQAWEDSIAMVKNSSLIRTVALRIGIVLSTRGGALEKMLLPLRFFIAAYFGSGNQWYSWIHIDDLCRMFVFAIENKELEGTYNAVAPEPQRNKPLTASLVRISGKKALLLPAPAFVLRLFMGEMADVVLSSTRVSAKKILDAGFSFQFPNLGPALADLLKNRH